VEAVAQYEVRAQSPWAIRIGIHTGPVAAGVVGIHKFAFDIWSDSVNFAARLQSTSPNRVNISTNTYSRVKDFFECEHRSQIETKEKKTFDMYFVNGLHPDLRGGANAEIPPGFARRYELYFSRPRGGFPACIHP